MKFSGPPSGGVTNCFPSLTCSWQPLPLLQLSQVSSRAMRKIDLRLNSASSLFFVAYLSNQRESLKGRVSGDEEL